MLPSVDSTDAPDSPRVPTVAIDRQRPVVGLAADYPPGARIPAHRHDATQLVFAVRGVMTVTTEQGTWVVPPERAVWVPAGVTHAIRMTGRVAIRTLYLGGPLEAVLGSACRVVAVSPLLHACILRAVAFPQPYPEDGPEARIVGVLADEIRAAEVAPLHLPLPRDPRARRVSLALRDAPDDPRRLADWARAAGASPRTLERIFARETGMGFAAWRQQARLLRGLERLAAGEPVTAVALQVGYETPSAFIAVFRRALGTSPGRYFARRAGPG